MHLTITADLKIYWNAMLTERSGLDTGFLQVAAIFPLQAELLLCLSFPVSLIKIIKY